MDLLSLKETYINDWLQTKSRLNLDLANLNTYPKPAEYTNSTLERKYNQDTKCPTKWRMASLNHIATRQLLEKLSSTPSPLPSI